MSNIIEKDGRRASHCPGKIKVTDSMSIPWVMRNHAIDRAEKVVFERKSSINTWVPVTWRQFYAEVRELARGLIAMGVQPNDHIAIMSHSRYEFALFDQAVWAVGAQLIPIYETDSTQQARWIIDDAHCRIAIAETRQLHDVLAPILNDVEHFETIHVIEEDAVDKISALGQPECDEEIDRRIDATTADDLATIIYTSGTTGLPKGARLSHRNLLHVAINGPLDDGLSHIIGGYQRSLLALPMAHVFARFICIMSMYSGNVTGFAPDAKNLVTDIQSFKPTYILAVPRIFEKIYNAADAKAGRGLKLKLFRHYAKVAIKYSRALDTPEGPSLQLRAQHRAGDRLVYSTIRNLLGGDLANSISGGAPLGERLGHFFRGIGITVHEGYGLTETSAPTTVNTPDFIRIGSVGPAYPGCYVSIGEDGEILCKGDHVFREYNNNPEATAEAFTEDGWFHTGDLGRIDDDGFVYITGRKKELIVTAGGKNVAPAILEDRLRGHPLVSQVVVVGDQKPFIGALATLDSEMLPGWLRNHGLPEMSAKEAAENPQVLAAIDRAIKRANEAVSRAESIRKFRILPIDFTVANGYMTPSMKLKRAAVLRDFADDIEKIYATD
ncbi:AMP-dependent synthetase/ligase [Peptidiphaga sp.]|jgi:putative coA ligase|uniref:AMP-dependent synthetase/ligase n=1 Tax=Peptidiphaga sp. TaxID=2848648 RepID=UPI003609DBC7